MSNGSESGNRRLLAYSEFEYLCDHNEVFSDIFASDSAVAELPVTIANASEPAITGDAASPSAPAAHDSALVRLVSGGYFQTLGVQPTLGRTFGPDTRPRARRLSRRRNQSWILDAPLQPGSPVLGRKIEINKTSFQIIGVAPAKFFGEAVGDSPDMWVPMSMQAAVYPGYGFPHGIPGQ